MAWLTAECSWSSCALSRSCWCRWPARPSSADVYRRDSCICIADRRNSARALSLRLQITEYSVFIESLCTTFHVVTAFYQLPKEGQGSSYSITERRVPELIPVLGSQPAGDVTRKPGGRLQLLSVRPAVTPATLKRAATSFAAW